MEQIIDGFRAVFRFTILALAMGAVFLVAITLGNS